MKNFYLKSGFFLLFFAFCSSLQASFWGLASMVVGPLASLTPLKASFAAVLGALFFFSPESVRDRITPVSRNEYQNLVKEFKEQQEKSKLGLKKCQEKIETLTRQEESIQNKVEELNSLLETTKKEQRDQNKELTNNFNDLTTDVCSKEQGLKDVINKNFKELEEKHKEFTMQLDKQMLAIKKEEELLEETIKEESLKNSQVISENHTRQLEVLQKAKTDLNSSFVQIEEAIQKVKNKAIQLDEQSKNQSEQLNSLCKTVRIYSLKQEEHNQTLQEKLNRLSQQIVPIVNSYNENQGVFSRIQENLMFSNKYSTVTNRLLSSLAKKDTLYKPFKSELKNRLIGENFYE